MLPTDTARGAAVAIHLLDFALFEDKDQAVWCFELRDSLQPHLRPGEELQFNLIELPKADRLGVGGPALRAWVAFLKHWQEEQRMSEINYPPVREAMDRIKDMSGDLLAWHEATRRQIAIMDEKQFRKEAIEEGHAKGHAEGLAEGLAKGLAEGKAEGQAAILERLLVRRFGPLSTTNLELLRHAGPDQLGLWADRFLDATRVDEVFAG